MPKLCDCPLKKRANYNLPGQYASKWCFNCPDKPVNAVDVRHKKCLCGKHRPSFNLPNKTIAIWCAECKLDNAIDVINPKCICGKHTPRFSSSIKTKPIWFSVCPDKPKEAINIVDILCKCGKYANYNLPGKTKPIWCVSCPDKPIGAVDVKHSMCNHCNSVISNKKYNYYCVRCYIYLFPDKPISKKYKIKENHIFDALSELLPKNIEFFRDKTTGGCSKRRPDLMIDMGSHWICAENDENSHKNYADICENKRTMELYTDMGSRPMILVRFNCDKYSEGQSLFKMCGKTGIFVIRSKKEFQKRITKFSEVINKFIESEPPEKAITTEYLYYD
jgi:hypothetical protein